MSPIHPSSFTSSFDISVESLQHTLASYINADASGPSIPPTWSWVAKTLARLFFEYPGGITRCIAESELLSRWNAYVRDVAQVHEENGSISITCINDPGNAFVDNVFECTVVSYQQIPGTSTVLLQVADKNSKGENSLSLEAYMHQRFFVMTQEPMLSLLQSNRHFRMTGVRTVASPYTHFNRSTKKVPLRILPTDSIVWTLSPSSPMDKDFLEMNFFDVLDDILSGDDSTETRYRDVYLTLQVVRIEDVKQGGDHGHTESCTVHLVDPSGSGESAKLVFYDEQTCMRRVVKVGDSLSLWRPYIHDVNPDEKSITFLYGSQTILFVVPNETISKELEQVTQYLSQRGKSHGLNHVGIPRTREGLCDFHWYPSAINIRDVPSRSCNITFEATLCKVESVMNALYPEVRLTLEDDSGICHVRCVGEFAIRARRLFPGQKVLLTDLIDSKESSQHHEGLLFEMTNTSMLYALSSFQGLLTSPFSYRLLPLLQVGRQKWSVVHGIITSWFHVTGRDSFITTIHTECGKEISMDHVNPFCKGCHTSCKDETQPQVRFGVIVDDGTAALPLLLSFEATGSLIESISCSMEVLVNLEEPERAQILNKLCGKSITASIVSHPEGNYSFRIDGLVTECHLIAMSQNLLEQKHTVLH